MEIEDTIEKRRIQKIIEEEMKLSDLYRDFEKVRKKLKEVYDIDLSKLDEFSQDEEIDNFLKSSKLILNLAYYEYFSSNIPKDKIKDYYVQKLYLSENGIKDTLYYLKKIEENYIERPRKIMNRKEYLKAVEMFKESKEVYFSTLTDCYDALKIFVAKNILEKYKSKEEIMNDLVKLSLINKVYVTSENLMKVNAIKVLYFVL